MSVSMRLDLNQRISAKVYRLAIDVDTQPGEFHGIRIVLPRTAASISSRTVNRADVRFWPKADMPKYAIDAAIGGKADMKWV